MQTFPDFTLNIVLAILAPLVTALVAALTFVVRDWHIRRDANGRKTRAIEQATKQVQFIDVWLSVYGKSSSPRQDDVLLARAMQDLEHAFRAVTDAASEPMLERQGLGKAVKAMLLIPLYGTGAQIVRVVYYIGSALGILLLFSLVKSSVSDILAGRSSIYVAVAVDIVFLIILAVPQILLWYLARSLESRAQRTRAATHGSPQPDHHPPVGPSSGYIDPAPRGTHPSPYVPSDPTQWAPQAPHQASPAPPR